MIYKESFLACSGKDEQDGGDFRENIHKREVKDFSKEFFPQERSKLVAELLYLRRKYRKDIPEENEQKRIKREQALEKLNKAQGQVDIVNKKFQETVEMKETLNELKLELVEISDEIEERKQSLLKKWFGRIHTEELNRKEEEIKSKIDEISRALGRNINIENQKEEAIKRLNYNREEFNWVVKDTEETIIDENWNDLLKQKVDDFYSQQAEGKDDYESNERRNVEVQSVDRNRIFAHGIPMKQRAFATGKNEITAKKELSFEERVLIVTSLEPAISVSSKKLDKDIKREYKNELAYPNGLVLGSGKIMMIFNRNEVNYSIGYDIKQTKYGDERLHLDVD